MYVDKINKEISLFSGNDLYSYTDFVNLVAAWQIQYTNKGLKEGDTVGFYGFLDNTATLAALVAAFESGFRIINIPTNYYLSPHYFADFFKDLKMLLCTRDAKSKDIKGFPSLDITGFPIIPEDAKVTLLDEAKKDDAVFTYFTSGTTAATPADVNHTHDSILFASEQSAQHFYKDGDVVLMMECNTLNHFGILTTTWLPALFKAKQIVFYEHYVEFGHDEKVSMVTLFDWQGEHVKQITEKQMFADNARVITGGVRITSPVLDMLFSDKAVGEVHNIYGDTEVCTPLFWKTWTTEEYAASDKSMKSLNYLDSQIDDLEIVGEEKSDACDPMVISAVKHARFYTKDPIALSDNVTNEQPRRFVNRKQYILAVHYEDGFTQYYRNYEMDYLLQQELGSKYRFVTFKNIIDAKKGLAELVAAYVGPKLTVDKLNQAVQAHHNDKPLHSVSDPFAAVFKLDSFDDFYNGLKIDYQKLRNAYTSGK